MTSQKKMRRSFRKFFKRNLIIILVIISILLFIFSFIAPYLFTLKTSVLNQDFSKTGAIGDTIGGLMNPFIALSGVCVTFLAFFMQYKANKIQVKNFRAEQKKNNKLLKEQLFFRLFESLNQRIVNFSYSENVDRYDKNNKTFNGYIALSNLAKAFKTRMDERSATFGRQLLAKMPERIPEVNLKKLVNIDDIHEYEQYLSFDDFKSTLLTTSYDERWEYIKSFVGRKDHDDVHRELASIGSVLFYKLALFEKEELYYDSYSDVNRTYGGFIDGYIKNLKYLLMFIEKNDSKGFFLDYMVSNMTIQEFITVFYYCASRYSGSDFKRLVKKFGLLKNLHLAEDSFIDSPTEENLAKEIEEILDYEAEDMLNYLKRF